MKKKKIATLIVASLSVAVLATILTACSPTDLFSAEGIAGLWETVKNFFTVTVPGFFAGDENGSFIDKIKDFVLSLVDKAKEFFLGLPEMIKGLLG